MAKIIAMKTYLQNLALMNQQLNQKETQLNNQTIQETLGKNIFKKVITMKH